jgi:hypothetical protein
MTISLSFLGATDAKRLRQRNWETPSAFGWNGVVPTGWLTGVLP